MKQFSDRIAFARKRMGPSQAQLASALGVSRGACGQWEQGVSTPSVAHLIELAKVTEVSFEWLATGRGPMETGEVVVEGKSTRGERGVAVAGRPLTGDLREIVIWMQKLPEERRAKVVKLLRNLRLLME